MSNLFKSKFLIGAMMAVVMFVGVAGVTHTAKAASCTNFTMTLKYGMRNSQVLCLQQMLNEKGFHVDGVSAGSAGLETTYFGNATLSAVKVMQRAIDGAADGIFGPMSRAALLAYNPSIPPVVVVYANGCTSNAGYSTTTGLPCSSVTSFPAGCTSNAGYSSTTGLPCNSVVGVILPAGCASAAGYSVTTGMPCTVTTVNSGTNGYLTDIASDSSNRVSTVYESEQDKVVAGFRATARLADQTVNRIRVQMRNTDTNGSSVSLAKYISGASVWMGSTKLATMAITDADRSTSDDTYTFNFSGLTAKVLKDQIGHFYVSVNANGSLDTNDSTNANWAVVFPDGGVLATSPDGSSDTYNASAGNVGTLSGSNVGFTFGKFSANGVKATVGLSSTNPAAAIVGVNATSATNNVTLLKFTVKATNSNLTLRKVPVQFVSTGSNISELVNTVRLYRGADLIDSADGSALFDTVTGVTDPNDTTLFAGTAGGYLFSNLSSTLITAGSTAEFSVVVDLKSQSAGPNEDGNTIMASIVNADVSAVADFGVYDQNGDALPAGSTYRLGSAIGNVMTLYVNGVNTVMGSASYTTTEASNGDITSVTWSIPMTVTAFGNDLYIGQTTQKATTATASGAVAFVFQNAAGSYADETSSTASHTIVSDDASANILGTGFLLPSGTPKHFHVSVTLTAPTTLNTYYRVQLKQIRTFTDSGLGLGAASTNLLPVDSYRTSPVFINN